MANISNEKKDYARMLFMEGMPQKQIAEKVKVSAVTVSKWAKEGDWQKQRAAKTVTRTALVNKLLLTIDKLISQVNQSEDPEAMASLGDKLSKLSSTIEKLDKKASVVDAIEVFTAFCKWLQYRMSYDSELTPELLKAINKYQDLYIAENMQIKL